jgi:Xaa-Pro aminopeptidase
MTVVASDRPEPIRRGEFENRLERARATAAETGADGIVVVGRGGGTHDRHGDLMYLTGHYQAYSYLRDRPPLWTHRAHSILVAPVEGKPTLICSTEEPGEVCAISDVQIGDIGALAPRAIGRLVRPLLVGADVLPLSLARRLPLGACVVDDEFVERLRRVKSESEQAILRFACALGRDAFAELAEAAVAGATEADAASAAAGTSVRGGAAVYFITIAAGDRNPHYTGRPSPGFRGERRFVAGEIVRVDLCLVLDGYYCDFGRTFVVPGARNDRAQHLISAAEEGLAAAVDSARPGASAGEIARVGTAALPAGISAVYPPHWGHGLGMGWEGPWLLEGNEELIAAGYALAVETCVSDGTLFASGEHDILVTNCGPEVLTS